MHALLCTVVVTCVLIDYGLAINPSLTLLTDAVENLKGMASDTISIPTDLCYRAPSAWMAHLQDTTTEKVTCCHVYT